MRSPDLPNTRQRILEAAVARFGQDGFDASLRAVAADVGVSAPAILKHFESKETLRRECDAHVLTEINKSKFEAMQSQDLGGVFLTQMAMLDEYQPLVRYLMRSIMTGGSAGRELLNDMRESAQDWVQEGVAAGHLTPSRNEKLRVKFALSISIGWMVQSVLMADKDLSELDAQFWKLTFDELMLPSLEVFTEGFLTDRALLDAYLQQSAEVRPERLTTQPGTDAKG